MERSETEGQSYRRTAPNTNITQRSMTHFCNNCNCVIMELFHMVSQKWALFFIVLYWQLVSGSALLHFLRASDIERFHCWCFCWWFVRFCTVSHFANEIKLVTIYIHISATNKWLMPFFNTPPKIAEVPFIFSWSVISCAQSSWASGGSFTIRIVRVLRISRSKEFVEAKNKNKYLVLLNERNLCVETYKCKLKK